MYPATLEKVKRALILYSVEGDLRNVCELAGIAYITIFEARKEYPIIEQAYQIAREMRADILADEVTEIADTDPNPHSARIRCDARRWAAGVLNRKVYGEKVDMTIEGRVDMSLALTEARQRVLTHMGRLEDVINAEITENDRVLLSRPTDKQSVDSVAHIENVDIFAD
jgi:hypothetical protein